MDGPSKPGNDPGEVLESNGREWTWDGDTSSWRPTNPRAFEVVSSLSPTPSLFYWEPILTEWLPVETPVPDDFGDQSVVVRSWDEGELG